MFSNFACAIQRKTHRLLAVLERLGIDTPRLREAHNGDALLAAARECVSCGNDARCNDWLESVPGETETAPQFCPNASFLAHQAAWPSAIGSSHGEAVKA